jgi:hypothetical protein
VEEVSERRLIHGLFQVIRGGGAHIVRALHRDVEHSKIRLRGREANPDFITDVIWEEIVNAPANYVEIIIAGYVGSGNRVASISRRDGLSLEARAVDSKGLIDVGH